MAAYPPFFISNLCYLHSQPERAAFCLYLPHEPSLEEDELLASRPENLMRLDLEHVEADCLGNGSALANSDDVAFLDESEGGRAVRWDVGVALFKAVVLLDEVQVVPAHNDSAVHLGGNDHASENAATDADAPSEGTVVVNVSAVNGFFGRLEAQTDVLPVPHSLAGLLRLQFLGVQEDRRLLLEGTLSLDVSHSICH